jgi:serine/threonine protein kinase
MIMEVPARIGKYEILSTLGRGGMGVVYRAQDPRIGRPVAIKTVTQDLSKDAGTLQRFYREAEKMGMLKHPNIITVYDLGEHDGFPYIVMEFVEGEPLDRLIKANEPLPLTYKLWIIEQVCSALGYAHHNDVVHRDVKPANVIVRPDGVAKLLDFGIARQEKGDADLNLTQDGGVIGTVPYMAPERLKGAPLDSRCDIFAAGVLLFQFLTGQLPFTGAEVVLVNKLVNEKHPPLSDYLADYPAALDTIIDRSLEKNPADRYQTAEEMATDLYAVIETLKNQYSGEMIAQAERQSAELDFVGARDTLQQLLKLDNQHTLARRLLADVNQHLTLKLRAEQAFQKKNLADDAIRERKYDDAIRFLEEATRLVPDDQQMAEHLAAARIKKKTSDQIVGYLVQADAAKKIGDYVAAQAIVKKAIQLDTSNSRLRAAYLSLVKQAEESAQRAKVKALLETAAIEMGQRKYHEVIGLIRQAQEISPLDPNAQNLLDTAKEMLFQEERKRLLHEIDELISDAASREETEHVAGIVQLALEKTPSDPSLLRYRAQLDLQMREYESQDLVDATLKQCVSMMDTSPLQALEVVRKALLQVPGEERLITLESNLQDRIARRTEEETRRGILLEAREALTQRRFADAVAILDQCRGSVRTSEISELLEFARRESEREQQQSLVANAYAEALSLQRDGKHEALVQYLRPLLNRVDDVRLRKMLAETESHLARLRSEEESALSSVRQSIEAEWYEQALVSIQNLPEWLASRTEIKMLQAVALEAWKRQLMQLEQIGRQYANLDACTSLDGLEMLSGEAILAADSGMVRTVARAFESRRTEIVDSALINQIKALQEAKAADGKLSPKAELAVNSDVLKFASESVRADWTLLVGQPKSSETSGTFLQRLSKKNK